jgi:diaminopimelate decarboxylase
MKPLPEARIQFELGRAVCTRALSTVITVRSVKRGLYPDAAILLTDGNTALLGPLHRGVHPVRAHYARAGEERVFMYGNLPHSGDWLMQDLTLPPAEIGDQIEILHTGAYFLPLEARFGCALPAIVHESTGEILRPGR